MSHLNEVFAVRGHKSEELFSVTTTELETLGISIKDRRAQCLASRIREQAFYVPCSARSLNFVVTAAFELPKLYTYYVNIA